MRRSKRYIPILIALALLGLIGLQIVWLVFVYRYKEQELKDKTREAVLETTKRLQNEEDSKLILNNLDSLLVTDNIIGSDTKSDIRVIVSSIKGKLKSDTLKGETLLEKKVKITGDTTSFTTVYKINNTKHQKVLVRTESINGNIKKKAGDLENLFLKMAIESNDKLNSAASRIDFKKVEALVKEELLKRGIDMPPKIIISSSLKELNNIKLLFPGMQTPHSNFRNESFVSLPLFPNDIVSSGLILEVGFQSRLNYVIKQMALLLSLSLIITLLIGFVMIYVFKRLLSQEKLNALKNDLVNNITHELKTPIATMSLAIDAINNPLIKNDTDKFNNYTRILKEENTKLNNHVEHVLQLALLEKSELLLHSKPIELMCLLQKCIHDYQLQIQNKNATVEITGMYTAYVLGDEAHLHNAFSNLLDNALKYSHANCQIMISVIEKGNNYIISFKDNGIGIATDKQDKVFDKFYRVQGGNLHDVKGFGIGLSYVRSVIEAHEGTIDLISEPANGSEFIIKLKKHGA